MENNVKQNRKKMEIDPLTFLCIHITSLLYFVVLYSLNRGFLSPSDFGDKALSPYLELPVEHPFVSVLAYYIFTNALMFLFSLISDPRNKQLEQGDELL